MMPKHCVIAGCDAKNSEGFSLRFACEMDLSSLTAEKELGWYLLLCSKHFESHCFITEGCHYRDEVSLPQMLKAQMLCRQYSLTSSVVMADQQPYPED